MRGTTVCPHCNTRFKITKAQLDAHNGLVRCGHCMEAFDTRPNFVPDQLDLQLELPMMDGPFTSSYSKMVVLQPMTLAEQVAFVQDDDGKGFLPMHRTWPWAIASLLLLIVLLAQSTYFFRVDLAARLPIMKPVLLDYCQMLGCNIPLPRNSDLISIVSSDLEAVPAQENQVILNALLRNSAPYAQAFPNLELTLNDIQDQPLARRIFGPADYLMQAENQDAGMQPNSELGIKLHLYTTELKPRGYRLVLFYPSRQNSVL